MQYHFEPFLLDTGCCELLRDGQPVELRPKAFAMLVYLIEHAERVVLRQELLDADRDHCGVGRAGQEACAAARAAEKDASSCRVWVITTKCSPS